ncbi:MAG TPA: hypothetical protein VM867_05980 [Xanthobacteraceae bacterium]|nr:hypothetical protein [Xanthobacteraceae bacterium]
MAFEVKVESENLLKQFDDMQKRVTELNQKLPEVFLDWQRDDMNRKFPKINEQGDKSVTTFIYPRSRLPRTKGGNNTTRKRARVAAGRPGSTRPILREELVVKLFERMRQMCREAIEWQ